MILAIDWTGLVALAASMGFWGVVATTLLVLVMANIPLIIKMSSDWYKRKTSGNHHASCPHFADDHYYDMIMPYIDRSVRRALNIYHIRETVTIKEQMNIIDRSVITVKNLLMTTYKKHSTREADVRFYSIILDKTLYESKELLREWVKVNHLNDRSEADFLSYVRDTSEALLDAHRAMLDDFYYSEDFELNRGALRALNESENIGDIKSIVEKTLFSCREVTRAKQAEIEELKAQDIFMEKESTL